MSDRPITPVQQALVGVQFERLGIKGPKRHDWTQTITKRPARTSISALTTEQGDELLAVLKSCDTVDALNRAVTK